MRHDADLTQLFPNRFDLVSGTPGVPQDEDPRALDATQPFDVASTKRRHPVGGPQPTEEPVPANEEPVLRPAGAIRGGDTPPDAVPAEDDGESAPDPDEEVSDGDTEPPARKPAAKKAAGKHAAKPKRH